MILCDGMEGDSLKRIYILYKVVSNTTYSSQYDYITLFCVICDTLNRTVRGDPPQIERLFDFTLLVEV